MKKNIRNLIALQAIDSEIQKLDQEIAQGKALLEDQHAGIGERKNSIEVLQEKIIANEKRSRELEADTEDEIIRVKDRQAKLMNVQTNREYQSLLREIEDGKKTNNTREEEIVLLMEQTEAYQNSIKEEENLCAEEEGELLETKSQMDQKAAKLATKKEKVVQDREKKSQKIAVSLLKKYDQLRAKRNGVAVASATGGVCQGCFMNIPPQMFNELLREKELLSCPTCNRLLFNKEGK